MRRAPLPPQLIGGPFTVRDSALPPKRLRARDLDASVYGVRALRGPEPATVIERCRMFAVRLRDDAVFSHTTAALLLGLPLDWRSERSALIHVTVPESEPAPHARGLRGHHAPLPPSDVVRVDGLAVTSAGRTWCDLAAMLHPRDLVAAGDRAIHHRDPLTSVTELTRRVARMSGRRGVRAARDALPLLNERSESRPESHLRLILVRAGFHPEINHELIDTESGRTVRPDFLLPGARVIVEYLGDHHRTRAQWRSDLTRRSRLEAQGWRVMELGADDLSEPDDLVRRIRTLIALTPRTAPAPRAR